MVLSRVLLHRCYPAFVSMGLLFAVAFGIRPAVVALLVADSRRAMQAGNYDLSRVRLRIAGFLDAWNPQIALLRARTHRHLQNYDAASALLERAQELGVSFEVVQRERVLAQAQRGGIPDAQNRVNSLLSTPFVDPAEVCDAFAYGAWQRDDSRQWPLLLDRWFEASPSDPRQFVTRGEMCEETRQWRLAEDAHRQALHLDPKNIRARLGLAACLLELSRSKEALEQFDWVLGTEPGNLSALEGRAKCLIEQGDLEQASKLLSQVLREVPHNFTAQLEMGRLELQQHRPKQAVSRLKPLAQQYPHHLDIQYNLALALRADGAVEEAAVHFRQHQHLQNEMSRSDKLMDRINRNPDDLEARYELGITVLKNFSPSRGVFWLNSVLARDPMHRRANEALAEYYERQGKSQLAAPHREYANKGKAANAPVTGTTAGQLRPSAPDISGDSEGVNSLSPRPQGD